MLVCVLINASCSTLFLFHIANHEHGPAATPGAARERSTFARSSCQGFPSALRGLDSARCVAQAEVSAPEACRDAPVSPEACRGQGWAAAGALPLVAAQIPPRTPVWC
jgi:hypothetical protein